VARPQKLRGVEEVASADAALEWLERYHGRTP
jgi:precorrin-6A/cobalt-precorrin-6A reductase